MAISRKGAAVAALISTAALVLSACGSGRTDDTATTAPPADETTQAEQAPVDTPAEDPVEPPAPAGGAIVLGTTDKVTTLDPAGAYDNGSYFIEIQVYRFLLGFPPGNPTPTPDLAAEAGFKADDPSVYEVVLKPGLTFANGHALTSSDVKFTFDRVIAIDDPAGPASLLAALDEVRIVDDLTVDFVLNAPGDVTWEQVLASPVGPILDEEVFPADALLPDNDIVAAAPFNGAYTINSFELNQMVGLSINPAYDGPQGLAKSDAQVKYYAESSNLRLDIESGAIDIAHRSLASSDIEALSASPNVTVNKGPGGEIRYIVFNLETMPGDSPEQKLAIRQAFASLIDRDELSEVIYKGTFTPLWSNVPDGLLGANTAFKDVYGAAPNPEAAAKFLSDAGVATPVEIKLQYSPEHYGPSSADEYGAIKSQLEATGLFSIELQSTEWGTYSKERSDDVYPVYQLGWFPDFPDPDNYLTVFFDKENFLHNHFADDGLSELLASERTDSDEAARAATIGQIQTDLATNFISTLPLLQGAQVAVSANGIVGVPDTLDASFQFRLAVVSRG